MNLYSVELKLCATAYIKANTKTEALAAAKKLQGESPAILDSGGDVPVSGRRYTDPQLPDVSLSPAMTIHGPWTRAVELSARNVPSPEEG